MGEGLPVGSISSIVPEVANVAEKAGQAEQNATFIEVAWALNQEPVTQALELLQRLSELDSQELALIATAGVVMAAALYVGGRALARKAHSVFLHHTEQAFAEAGIQTPAQRNASAEFDRHVKEKTRQRLQDRLASLGDY